MTAAATVHRQQQMTAADAKVTRFVTTYPARRGSSSKIAVAAALLQKLQGTSSSNCCNSSCCGSNYCSSTSSSNSESTHSSSIDATAATIVASARTVAVARNSSEGQELHLQQPQQAKASVGLAATRSRRSSSKQEKRQ
ncbi:hypothetical protein Emed_003769 [Eimeria media]